MTLLPPSAFEFPTDESTRRIWQETYEDVDRRVRETVNQKGEPPRNILVLDSPQKEPRIFESAIKNQASLIEQLSSRIVIYEGQIASLQRQLAQRDHDLESMAQHCENSMATLDEEHVKTIQKVETDLEHCRKQLEHEIHLRKSHEEQFKALEEKNTAKLGNLQASLDEKIAELKQARDESTKLRLYFTGGRDMVEHQSFEFEAKFANRNGEIAASESETVANLRVQIEALQHIIDIQEEQLRTNKPDLIPGLKTLEKWRRKVYEMMVRTKLNEIAISKEVNRTRQQVADTREQLKVTEAKLAAKEVEVKELKMRVETSQRLMSQTAGNEAKLKECLQGTSQIVAQVQANFKNTTSRLLLQIANMERRLELAAKRVKQIGFSQKNAIRLEKALQEKNQEKIACEMQLVVANESLDEFRRRLNACQQQLANVAKVKASETENIETDRAHEREAASMQIRLLTSELHELRVEHAKLLSAHSIIKRRLDEAEEHTRQSTDMLSNRLRESQQDYEALAKVAREHGIVDKIAARRVSTPGTPRDGTDAVRAQVESLYKSLIP